MKFVSGWNTLIRNDEGNIEIYVDEIFIRVDLTSNDGIDCKLLCSRLIN